MSDLLFWLFSLASLTPPAARVPSVKDTKLPTYDPSDTRTS